MVCLTAHCGSTGHRQSDTFATPFKLGALCILAGTVPAHPGQVVRSSPFARGAHMTAFGFNDRVATRFVNRDDAGRRLAHALLKYRGEPELLVLALPRGGVPVAWEVARTLRAPLDIFLVRKLGLPQQSELAMGAIASGGIRILNRDLIRQLGIPEHVIERTVRAEEAELERRLHAYDGRRGRPDLTDRTVILVDDGVATGSTILAAAKAIRLQHPAKLVIAVPVCARPTLDLLRAAADDVVCIETPENLEAVGFWYDDFHQTTDAEVRVLLDAAGRADFAMTQSVEGNLP
jgi:putative phosphoribosyl transferase